MAGPGAGAGAGAGPWVALVGRPNVGKSALFNRLARPCPRSGRRRARALEAPEEHTTRDWRSGPAGVGDLGFHAVDTAGLGPGAPAGAAEATADVLAHSTACLFLLDARSGVTPADVEAAAWLRGGGRGGAPVVVVVNKYEGVGPERAAELAGDIAALGLGPGIAVSALHGEGLADLHGALAPILDTALEAQGAESEGGGEEEEGGRRARPLRLVLCGVPNAGKSSLLNALVDEYAGGAAPRALVSPRRHTTRDSVEADFSLRLPATAATAQGGEDDLECSAPEAAGSPGPAVEVTVVDTAGSARRGRGASAGTPDELAAQVARVRTRALGGGAEVGVVVVDVSAPAGGPVDERAGAPAPPPPGGSAGWRGGAGLTRGEATGLREAWRRGLAVVVAASKADRLANLPAKELSRVRREVQGAVARALPEASGAPVVLCSAPPEAERSVGAKVGGLEALLRESVRLRARRARHTKTSRLNRWWRKVQGSDSAPPEASRVRFLVQTGAAPPAFAVYARWGAGGRQSRSGGEPLSGSSLRWVEGRLREFLQLQGVPLEVDVRVSDREGKGAPGR